MSVQQFLKDKGWTATRVPSDLALILTKEGTDEQIYVKDSSFMYATKEQEIKDFMLELISNYETSKRTTEGSKESEQVSEAEG